MKKSVVIYVVLVISFMMNTVFSNDQLDFFKKRFQSALFEEEVQEEKSVFKLDDTVLKPKREFKNIKGASITVGTGLITTPNIEVIEKDSFMGSLHLHAINVNGSSSTAKYFKLLYGVSSKLEVGFVKPYAGIDNRNDPDMYSFWKYKFKENSCIGGVIDASSSADDFRYMQSIYYLYGIKNVYAGIGMNFDFKRKDGVFAHFGSADESKSNLTFLMFGAEYQVHENIKIMCDYNGDFFSYGIRAGKDNFSIDIDQVRRGDNLSLLPFKDENQTVLGLNWSFR